MEEVMQELETGAYSSEEYVEELEEAVTDET